MHANRLVLYPLDGPETGANSNRSEILTPTPNISNQGAVSRSSARHSNTNRK